MNLSPRLAFIVNGIPKTKSVIDIAADHGYVALTLAKENIERKIIISDIALKPLESAQANFQQAGIINGDFRLGSGLQVLKTDETMDVAIIAGIGGRLMVDILADNLMKTNLISTFFLQANIGMSLVRAWLYEHNYHIVQDVLIKDGIRIYECLEVNKADNKDTCYSQVEAIRKHQFYFGTQIMEQEQQLKTEWLNANITKFEEKLVQLAKAKNETVSEKITEYEKLLKCAKELL